MIDSAVQCCGALSVAITARFLESLFIKAFTDQHWGEGERYLFHVVALVLFFCITADRGFPEK